MDPSQLWTTDLNPVCFNYFGAICQADHNTHMRPRYDDTNNIRDYNRQQNDPITGHSRI